MKRYSTMMSVLLTLALPVAGYCAVPAAPAKPGASKIEEIKETMAGTGHGMMSMAIADGDSAALDVSGKVVETMDSGGYTYAKLENDKKTTWVTYPTLETRVGDKLSFTGCLQMSGFQSKTLDRTFDTILFCSGPDVKTRIAGKTAPEAKKPQASGGFKQMKVEKASGPNAYTVAEIFEKRAQLDGKQVTVKGQVAKVSSRIMGKNWIHLQDGTGSASKKNNDLVITSAKDAPEVGAVVTVTGTVAKDKDFGSGYKYAVIVENGSVKK